MADQVLIMHNASGLDGPHNLPQPLRHLCLRECLAVQVCTVGVEVLIFQGNRLLRTPLALLSIAYSTACRPQVAGLHLQLTS